MKTLRALWNRLAASPRAVGVALFFFVAATHAVSPMVAFSDPKWAVHVSMSLLNEGDLDLDEYAPLIAGHGNFAVESAKGHLFSIYPVGGSVLAAPLLAAVRWFARYGVGMDLDGWLSGNVPMALNRLLASLVVALATVVLFSTARRQAGLLTALFVALLFAFGTSAWSTASRGLWQHGPSMLMLALAIFLMERIARPGPPAEQPRSKGEGSGPPNPSHEAPRWTFVALGAVTAAAYTCRPTNFVAVLAFTAWMGLTQRRRLVHYFAGAAVVALPFLAFNLWAYGQVLSPYYRPDAITAKAASVAGDSHFLEGALGQLLSPGRGLFFFSPVLVLSLWGAARARRDRMAWALGAVVVGHWLVISSFPMWWAGHCFGPRMFSDALPMLTWFLPFALAGVRAFSPRPQVALWVCVGALTAASLFAHYRGACEPVTDSWNWAPNNIDWEGRGRLWNFRDPQFLRGFRG